MRTLLVLCFYFGVVCVCERLVCITECKEGSAVSGLLDFSLWANGFKSVNSVHICVNVWCFFWIIHVGLLVSYVDR